MFEKGYTPWNKGVKGFRTSGSFSKGKPSHNAGTRNFPRERFGRAKYHCAKRGKEWRLTLEEYSIATAQPCHYCGGDLPKYGIGLDRKNSDIGYILENVVPCCSVCNDTKGKHLTYKEMMHLMQYRKQQDVKSTPRISESSQ